MSLKGRKKHMEDILREKLEPTLKGRGMCPIYRLRFSAVAETPDG